MDFPEFSAGLGKLRTAILEARRRIHAALRLDEIELLSDSFSAIGGRFDRAVIIADADFDDCGASLCSRESEWLCRKGYPVQIIRAELEPSFILVDDQLFVPQVPVSIVQEVDGGVIGHFEDAFQQAMELPDVEVPPYCLTDDEYFDEFSWFPVPLPIYSAGPGSNRLDNLLLRLNNAVRRRASDKICLSKWSRFIRTRDGEQCVVCGGTRGLAAHHICRKTLFPEARFMTGNGITLCTDCHREAHQGYNGRPDLQQLMDAQGGEKIELLAELYWRLAISSRSRPNFNDAYYYLGPQVLAKFKLFQGYAWDHPLRGSRIEQAAFIWRGMPVNIVSALIKANLPTPFGYDSHSSSKGTESA